MWPIENRIGRRDTRAFVAPETVDVLADKLIGIVADRRMVLMHRYLDRPSSDPRLTVGVRVWHGGFGGAVTRRPGEGVGISLAAPTNRILGVSFSVGRHGDGEDKVADRYRHPEKEWLQQRRDMTAVELNGWPGSPGREDRIRVEYWNDDGVGQETVLVFDDMDPVQEIAWDVKGDTERRHFMWNEFCDHHGLHYEHPDHPHNGQCKGRPSTRAEDLAVLAVLAERGEKGGEA